jgi:lipoyl-dependent peroxiredoxin
MEVKIPTLPKAEALALAEETPEKVRPYSHATRGNIEFSLVVEAAEESR